MYIEHEFFVGLRDIDFKNNLKIKSMLSFFEDVGGIHSNKVGYGLLDIPQKKRSWILINWKVQFIRRPHYSENIRVKTWARGMDRLYAFRDFEVFDEDNNLIAIASSKWVCFDTDKMSVTRINDDIRNAYTIEDKKVFEEEIIKLTVPENSISNCEIIITKDMIDVNEHVHNLDYIDFASQIFPYEVMQEATNIEVMYKKEIKYGDKIKGFYSIDGNEHIVTIKNDDETVIHAIIKIRINKISCKESI